MEYADSDEAWRPPSIRVLVSSNATTDNSNEKENVNAEIEVGTSKDAVECTKLEDCVVEDGGDVLEEHDTLPTDRNDVDVDQTQDDDAEQLFIETGGVDPQRAGKMGCIYSILVAVPAAYAPQPVDGPVAWDGVYLSGAALLIVPLLQSPARHIPCWTSCGLLSRTSSLTPPCLQRKEHISMYPCYSIRVCPGHSICYCPCNPIVSPGRALIECHHFVRPSSTI